MSAGHYRLRQPEIKVVPATGLNCHGCGWGCEYEVRFRGLVLALCSGCAFDIGLALEKALFPLPSAKD